MATYKQSLMIHSLNRAIAKERERIRVENKIIQLREKFYVLFQNRPLEKESDGYWKEVNEELDREDRDFGD